MATGNKLQRDHIGGQVFNSCNTYMVVNSSYFQRKHSDCWFSGSIFKLLYDYLKWPILAFKSFICSHYMLSLKEKICLFKYIITYVFCRNKTTKKLSWVSRSSSFYFFSDVEACAQLQIKPAVINDVLRIKYLVLLYQLSKTAASGDCRWYLEVASLLSQRENFIPLEIQSWGESRRFNSKGVGGAWKFVRKGVLKQACCFSYSWCVCLLCV